MALNDEQFDAAVGNSLIAKKQKYGDHETERFSPIELLEAKERARKQQSAQSGTQFFTGGDE